jgi:hypothetical protein
LLKIAMFRYYLACAIGMFSSGVCSATNVTGVVLDDQGKPIAGATVTVARSSVDGPLRAAEVYSTTTTADGGYSVSGLGAGPFFVCASVSGRPLLDPCEWSPTQVIVRLAGGTDTVNTTTQLELGATVSIRIDDPGLILSAPIAGQPQPSLELGVWRSDGHFHQARLASSNATGRNFSLAVAPDVNLAFAVAAQNLAVADMTTKVAIQPSQRINVNLAAGATLQLHYAASSAAASSNSSPASNQ